VWNYICSLSVFSLSRVILSLSLQKAYNYYYYKTAHLSCANEEGTIFRMIFDIRQGETRIAKERDRYRKLFVWKVHTTQYYEKTLNRHKFFTWVLLSLILLSPGSCVLKKMNLFVLFNLRNFFHQHFYVKAIHPSEEM